MCFHAPPRRGTSIRPADGCVQPAMLPGNAPSGEACGVCRNTPNHPLREQFRTPANTQRLPPSGKMRIYKRTRGASAQNTGACRRYSPQMASSPRKAFLPDARDRSPGLPSSSAAPSRAFPVDLRSFVRRTVAGPRRTLTGFPSIARTSTKNKLKATFSTAIRVYHEKDNVNRSPQIV